MMAARNAAVTKLLDQIQNEPGWRVVDSGDGWRIFPPDKDHAVITLKHWREIDYTKSALRRAGFRPLLKLKEAPMAAQPKEPAPVPVLLPQAGAAPPPPPRDLIAEARQHINAAVEALSALDGVLGEIQHEREAIAQIKSLFQTMMK